MSLTITQTTGTDPFNPFSVDDEGFEFPIGSNEGTCVFEDGLVWTAFKNDTLYCGGSTYDHGLQGGWIVTNGTATSLPVPDESGESCKPDFSGSPGH